MLEGLFDEEAGDLQSKTGAGEERSSRVPRPPAPRNSSGLCGLSNLGATCYLNSLLQTLHFTPEFRGTFVTKAQGQIDDITCYAWASMTAISRKSVIESLTILYRILFLMVCPTCTTTYIQRHYSVLMMANSVFNQRTQLEPIRVSIWWVPCLARSIILLCYIQRKN